MIAHQITDEEKALIQRFNDSAASIGMDGIHSLSPSDRGLIEATELAKKFTLLRALLKLNLQGKEARDFAWDLHRVDIPLTEEEVNANLKAILTKE